ncbi:UNVERIFIED_CONTAM: hypothetical protein GTU68_047118 [Idotea baltica]|nr:hypothetical protein [Idotea baltica]
MFLTIDWDVNPIILQLGSFELRWYSLCFAAGFIIGYQIMKRMFKREGIPMEWLESLLMYLVLGTIVGARLGHCIFYEWDYYSHHILEMLLPIQRGLASHGGAIAILILLWIFARRVAHKPYLWILDRVAVPVALAGFFIRLGNLMNSEILGRPTDASWGFIFRAVDDISRHPAQLYESLSYLCIFFFLSYLYWKKNAGDHLGRLFGWWLVLLWGARFTVEFFKRHQGGLEDFIGQAITTGQLLSLPFIAMGLFLLIRSYRKL